MRGITAGFAVLALMGVAACNPQIPDSGAGVGFDDYASYEAERAARDAQLSGTARATASAPIVPPARNDDPNAALASEAMAAIGVAGPADPSAEASAQGGADVVIDTNNPGISDENSFDAVSNRESIEDNAAKIAAQREAYEVIQPGALPQRRGGNAAAIVQFALSTTNRRGQALYSRSLIGAQSRFERNCAKYPSPDKAQEEFLKRGGPKRDPQGLDPDGDGFACAWDPAPFRLAAQG